MKSACNVVPSHDFLQSDVAILSVLSTIIFRMDKGSYACGFKCFPIALKSQMIDSAFSESTSYVSKGFVYFLVLFTGPESRKGRLTYKNEIGGLKFGSHRRGIIVNYKVGSL